MSSSTPQPPSKKRTNTDVACERALRKLVFKLEKDYASACPTFPAKPEFFEQMDRAEAKLMELLAVRPITQAEIDSITHRAYVALREGLRKARVEQPRFVEVIHYETGATRTVPAYD